LPEASETVGLARFTADSRLRSKIGLSRAGATGWIGAWDGARGVLTLVNHTVPGRNVPVPDCDWKPDNPRAEQATWPPATTTAASRPSSSWSR